MTNPGPEQVALSLKAGVQKYLDAVLPELVKLATAPLRAQVKAMRAEIEERIKAIPAAKDGVDGKNAEVDYVLIGQELDVRVAKAIAAVDKEELRGEKGEPGLSIKGDPGAPGKDGTDGKDGAPGEPGPKGDPGTDGAPGRDGKDGAPGERGEKGLDGKDGRDGREGKDGKDGRDGVATVEELKAAVALAVAEAVPPAVEKSTAPAIEAMREFQYRGVFQPETVYRMGNSVSYGNSLWICRVPETRAKPDEHGSKDWQLAVRKGRDGKDGKDGKPPGPVKL